MDSDKSFSASFLPTQSVVVESTTVNLSDADEEERNEPERACRVCGHLSHGYHFGILACRACAAFFRRTVVEKKTYRCRQSGQCEIRKEMRNMCRSCRYDLCIHLGMNKDDVQMYRDPIGKRNANKNSAVTSTAAVKQNGKTVVVASAASTTISSSTDGDDRLEPSSISSFVSSSAAIASTNINPSSSSSSSARLSSVVGIGGTIGISNATSTAAPSLSSIALMSSGDPFSTTITTPTTTAPAGLLHFAVPQPVRPLPALQQHQQQSQQNFTSAAGNCSILDAIALFPYAIPSSVAATAADPPSVLQRLVDGYRNFQSSQKSLYTVMYPDNIFANETYRLVKHSEYVKMERGCISLMYSMLVDYFQPFDSLDQQIKVMALRIFSNRFTHLDQCYRTVALFPANDDPRFVLHYGQYLSCEKLDHFFGESEHAEDTIKTAIKTIQKCRSIVAKIRDMAIRDVEIAAVAAIILWNELTYMNVEGIDRVRSSIFSELHNNMILTYGIANTGLRLGSLMDLVYDMNLIEKEIQESVIISKFFNQNFAEVWDDATDNF